eukprot:5120375-Prymnesium_polylepis.1
MPRSVRVVSTDAHASALVRLAAMSGAARRERQHGRSGSKPYSRPASARQPPREPSLLGTLYEYATAPVRWGVSLFSAAEEADEAPGAATGTPARTVATATLARVRQAWRPHSPALVHPAHRCARRRTGRGAAGALTRRAASIRVAATSPSTRPACPASLHRPVGLRKATPAPRTPRRTIRRARGKWVGAGERAVRAVP